MSRIGETLKRAGSTLWHGEKYMEFGDTKQLRPQERQPRIPFTDTNSPIQELGVMVGGSGAAITAIGAAIELTHLVSHEVGQMTLYGGLGGIAIGGAVYAYGKLAE